jgi:hypothetical protein
MSVINAKVVVSITTLHLVPLGASTLEELQRWAGLCSALLLRFHVSTLMVLEFSVKWTECGAGSFVLVTIMFEIIKSAMCRTTSRAECGTGCKLLWRALN